MKVRVTFDVDRDMRRAISDRVGRDKPATREEVERNITAIVEGVWQDYADEYGHNHQDDEGDND